MNERMHQNTPKNAKIKAFVKVGSSQECKVLLKLKKNS